jgi:hypothetical protein
VIPQSGAQAVGDLRCSECLASLLLQAQTTEALSPGRSRGPGDLRHCGHRADNIPAALHAAANFVSAKPRNSTAALEFRRATLQKGSSVLRRASMR